MPNAWGNKNGQKHGECGRGRRSGLHRRWTSIKQRCCNPNHVSYHNYGGRGITMCAEWMESYEAFATYVRQTFGMSQIPAHLEIDRRDNDKGYEPGNLRLSTRVVQSNNRRTNRYIQYEGERVTIAEAARRCGVKPVTLWGRLESGDPDPFRPVSDCRITYRGEKMTITELSKRTGVPLRRLNDRIRRQGLSIEDAVSSEFWGGKKHRRSA